MNTKAEAKTNLTELTELTVSVGTDHGGIPHREAIVASLKAAGATVLDHGASTNDSVDYPDYAAKVGADVSEGRAQFGVLICNNGIGMSIAANKFKNVRAARICGVEGDTDAALCRQHNNANVMCIGGHQHTPELAAARVRIFLTTPHETGGRHQRRVGKLCALDGSEC